MDTLTDNMLIVGIGSERRRDDEVGLEVTRVLEKFHLDGMDFGGGFSTAVKSAIPDVFIHILQDILTIRQPQQDVNGASLFVNGLTPLSP